MCGKLLANGDVNLLLNLKYIIGYNININILLSV